MLPTDRLTGRFGVEIELNSLDGRNFVKNPLARGEMPAGIDRVAEVVRSAGFPCDVHDWRYDHNPTGWSCKPDNSCGIEVCSPVIDLRGLTGLATVMDALSADSSLSVDDRCSLHVHLELSGMECDEFLGSILAWWIKCEHVFFDFAHPYRKNNRYCRPIGVTDIFDSEDLVVSEALCRRLSFKYLSINTYHLFNRRRPTIEFRIAEGTKDSSFAINWIRLLLVFSERALSSGLPKDYLWLSPCDVLDFMNLDADLEGWFLGRLVSNCTGGTSEFFSRTGRVHAMGSYSGRTKLNNGGVKTCPNSTTRWK